MKNKSSKKLIVFGFIFFLCICFINISSVQAQIDWWPLPPYNTLWPLWSPTLSPPNILGVPQPIVGSLTPDTVLPVEPGLTWDPRIDYPWLLYNTPSGMVYYDPIFGIDLWPPKYFLDALGSPIPIDLALIKGWSTLAPTKTSWLSATIPVANAAYYTSYPIFAPLLSTAGVLGLPALIP